MSTDERVYEAVKHTDYPRKAIAPDGDTIEIRSLATVRDLAVELGLSENAVRLSVRRLTSAGRVFTYHLLDRDAGTRRLYISAENLEATQVPTLADLFFDLAGGNR